MTGADETHVLEAGPPFDRARGLLVVEDSPFFLNVVHKRIEDELPIRVVEAASLAAARAAIEGAREDFFLALLDLNLPDAPDGEVVDYVLAQGIPCVVFTGSYSEELRGRILSMDVIDYVTKDSPASLDYLLSLVRRLYRNRGTTALVVDDSRSTRAYIADLLLRYQFQVMEAGDGVEALQRIEEHPEIRLVVTDYHMPKMDGFELIKNIRRHYGRESLAIVGVSTAGSAPLSAKFIKFGANDFINKPFLREEFFCRVAQTMDALDHIQSLLHAATVDPLTGLHNRRLLMDAGERSIAGARRTEGRPVLAVLDIDKFKAINDTYGHDAGDRVLIGIAEILRRHVRRRSDIVARVGGEEFCMVLHHLEPDGTPAFFDEIRSDIERTPFHVGLERPIHVTVSIGVNCSSTDDLATMMKAADRLLYAAKGTGRNRVMISGA